MMRGLIIGSGGDCAGEMVSADGMVDYIAERFGIGCRVETKPDGVIIVVSSIRSVETLVREIRYSHDFITGSRAKDNMFFLYVQSEVTRPSMRLALN